LRLVNGHDDHSARFGHHRSRCAPGDRPRNRTRPRPRPVVPRHSPNRGPELERFLAEERVVTCATLGPNGRPHLERVPQATLQIEAGDTYGTLRGVMLECDVEILRAAVPPHPDRSAGTTASWRASATDHSCRDD